MAENKTELLLKNINDKIRNRNIFTWKILFGWIIAVPVICLGLLLSMLFHSQAIYITFMIIGVAIMTVNFIIGMISLYRSTKDSK